MTKDESKQNSSAHFQKMKTESINVLKNKNRTYIIASVGRLSLDQFLKDNMYRMCVYA